MGVVGITVPEEHGGMGLGLVDVVLLLEEAGRAGLPEPLVETAVLGVPRARGRPARRATRCGGAGWRGGRRRGVPSRGDVVHAGRSRRRRGRPAAPRARR